MSTSTASAYCDSNTVSATTSTGVDGGKTCPSESGETAPASGVLAVGVAAAGTAAAVASCRGSGAVTEGAAGVLKGDPRATRGLNIMGWGSFCLGGATAGTCMRGLEVVSGGVTISSLDSG